MDPAAIKKAAITGVRTCAYINIIRAPFSPHPWPAAMLSLASLAVLHITEDKPNNIIGVSRHHLD